MNKFLPTLLIVLYAAYSSAAQEFVFQTLTVEDGLSQSSVTCLAQDVKGFLWIGTRDGLNRYDGESFTVFRKTPFDTNSLRSNVIHCLQVDDDHGLYIGTEEGLQHYNLITNQFHSIPLTDQKAPLEIRSIYKDQEGVLWISSIKKFFKVVRNKTSGRHHITPFLNDKGMDTGPGGFSFFHDSRQNFWVTSTKGIIQFPYDSLQSPGFQFDFSKAIQTNSEVIGVRENSSGDIVAYGRGGLYRYDSQTNTFLLKETLPDLLPNTRINPLSEDQLWTLREDGLSLISIRESPKTTTQHITLPPLGLSKSRHLINYVLKDKIYDDFYWLATDIGGVIRMYKRKKKFHTTWLKDIPGLEVTNPYLRHIVAERDNVWLNIGHGVVLHRQEQGTFQFSKAMFQPGSPISSTSVSALTQSADGKVYVTTSRGIAELGVNTAKQISVKNHLLTEKERADFNAIIESKTHFIKGGRSGTISVLQKDSFKEVIRFQPQIPDQPSSRSEISSLLLDHHSNLWVGTVSGLFIYPNFIPGYDRLPKSVYVEYNPSDTSGLVDNRITSLFQDSKNTLWVCTRNGLMSASYEKGQVHLKHIKNPELQNQVLYGVLESKHVYELWLSSNNGLYRYNPVSGEVDNFNYHDGLQGNEFNTFSFFQAASGEMFFGGPKGFTYFFPEEILPDTTAPPIWITKLTTTDNHQFNLLARDTDSPLELGFSERSFSIRFIGLNYKNEGDIRYYYNLRGTASLQNVDLGYSQQVNFSQLDPGSYTLEIFSKNKNGDKHAQSDFLHFTIHAPFWRLPWFIALMALTVAFLGWLLFYLRYQNKLRQLKVIEQVRKNISEDFHDELGSKLSIISMYSEFTKQELNKPNSKASTYLDKVNDTASRLYENTRDLIWALNPQNDSLYDLFLQLKDFGEEMFQDTDIDFHSAGLADHWKNKNLPMRYKRHLLLIFKEGMHNALKHAHCKTIRLSIDEKNKHLIIMLQDDGTGFDADAEHKGDGLKNMAHRAEQLHGGLHFISKKEGTRIWVEIPFDILN